MGASGVAWSRSEIRNLRFEMKNQKSPELVDFDLRNRVILRSEIGDRSRISLDVRFEMKEESICWLTLT